MKRRRVVLAGLTSLAGLATAAVLAGCGGSPSERVGGAAQGGAGQGGSGRKVTVQVAAASDVRFALDEVIAGFQRQYPDVSIKVSYGSSGNFATQLANGAPFDVFLSADTAYPTELEKQGLTAPGSRFDYAVGRLVVWAARTKGYDLARTGLAGLTDPRIRTVAIANPQHAPYGRAAVAALTSAGIYDRVKPKLVYGENIAQAAEFVAAGTADAGIIASSLTKAPAMDGKGDVFPVPPDLYPPVIQEGVVMRRAADLGAAGSFTAYLRGEPGRAILTMYGYVLPGQ